MARLPYARTDGPDIQALVADIVAQRGEVLHLYQMLLHSPPITEGWLRMMTAVRHETSLPGSLRELVIIRIGYLNDAPYEAEQHRPIALREGCSEAQVDALRDWGRHLELFDDKQQAALALTDKMTRDIHADDATWQAVRSHWNERELVELVVTIASYNMVSRVIGTLQIHSEDERP
jgi:alkylhydroperoxidase family enzyme